MNWIRNFSTCAINMSMHLFSVNIYHANLCDTFECFSQFNKKPMAGGVVLRTCKQYKVAKLLECTPIYTSTNLLNFYVQPPSTSPNRNYGEKQTDTYLILSDNTHANDSVQIHELFLFTIHTYKHPYLTAVYMFIAGCVYVLSRCKTDAVPTYSDAHNRWDAMPVYAKATCVFRKYYTIEHK